MAAEITSMSRYSQRVKLVHDVLKAHSKLDDKAAGEIAVHVLETNLTIQGNRLNVITKKVTGWAAIIAVPTAVTGFYGQNVPYPGFSAMSGFVWSSLLIVALSGGLFIVFRRKGWL